MKFIHHKYLMTLFTLFIKSFSTFFLELLSRFNIKFIIIPIPKYLHISLILYVILFFSSNLISAQNDVSPFTPVRGGSKPVRKSIISIPEEHIGIKIAQNERKKRLSDSPSVGEDTSAKDNRIELRVDSNGDLKLRVELKDYNQRIYISAWNILGKKVESFYEDYPHKNPDDLYFLDVSRLPNGVYICVVQGDNFRLREKFVVSR